MDLLWLLVLLGEVGTNGQNDDEYRVDEVEPPVHACDFTFGQIGAIAARACVSVATFKRQCEALDQSCEEAGDKADAVGARYHQVDDFHCRN